MTDLSSKQQHPTAANHGLRIRRLSLRDPLRFGRKSEKMKSNKGHEASVTIEQSA